ncbi:branched-chain amino acid ABC transporter permease [Alicyclobacillus tolerans]|uniref:branched-chain amino acid ABC transporter permease n=1 Tax=Alicyclobacillus tolerans TaxID=90970 RepID=UPI001F3C25C3|nr:branched-chain amino acid ABC transporter permease [Alicyclobacillus tolerans]MCF8567296.1 branched-chain amino acid ABC transporter permease [Alicyclobacillus tolerans]
MSGGTLLVQVLSGLSIAAVLFIVASGMTLVFGTMRVINMTHGSFYMFGAYLLTITFQKFDHHLLGFVAAFLLSAVVVLVLGIVIEFLVLRRLYKGEHLLQLLATWALMLVFEQVALDVWGSSTNTPPSPASISGTMTLGSASIPVYYVFLIVFALIIFFALWLFNNRTGIGRLLRAAVEDHELLSTIGVNVRRLYTVAFAVGAFLAALGGALIAPEMSVGPGIDLSILVQSFVVAVVGGLGSINGALLGAVIIGLAESFGATYFPNVAEASIYFVMVIVLIIRPRGLFGKEEF